MDCSNACIFDNELEEHFSHLLELYDPSIIEAYRIAANVNISNFRHQRRNIFFALISIGFYKNKKSFRWGLPLYTSYSWKAVKKGYLPGEHVLDGIYVLQRNSS